MLSHRPQGALLLSTKLRLPTLPPDFVARSRVYERLDEGNGRRLTLVCAPAGFGKTLALAGWLRDVRKPCANPSGTHSMRLFAADNSTPNHLPKVAEDRRRSTVASHTAPATTRMSFPCGPGCWKCIPRKTPLADREWLS